jgi:DNA repair ATPase RecN
MNQIDKLTTEIEAIELQAGTMDPSDFEGLYKLLAQAYFKAKDIIELSKDINPIIDTSPQELQEAKEAYNLASTQAEIYKNEVTKYKQFAMEIESKINEALAALQG